MPQVELTEPVVWLKPGVSIPMSDEAIEALARILVESVETSQ